MISIAILIINKIMKKIFYTFLAASIMFVSCKKEEESSINIPNSVEGCTNSTATNYNINATSDDGSCIYDITGIWETQTALFNGVNQLMGLQLTYIWDAGAVNRRTYDADTIMTSYIAGPAILTDGDPSVLAWTGTAYPTGSASFEAYLTVNIDKMLDDSNMTWRYTTADGTTVVETLVKSTTYTLSDWK